MPGFSVEVKGLAELKAKLDTLAKSKAKGMQNRALRAGAEVYRSEIQSTAPVRSPQTSSTALPPGALQHDIEIHTLRDADNPTASIVTVGPGKYTRFAARMLEFGHLQVRNTGLVVGTKGKGRGRLGKGGTVVTQVDPNPFLRRAYEAKQGAALDAVVSSLRADLANVKGNEGGD